MRYCSLVLHITTLNIIRLLPVEDIFHESYFDPSPVSQRRARNPLGQSKHPPDLSLRDAPMRTFHGSKAFTRFFLQTLAYPQEVSPAKKYHCPSSPLCSFSSVRLFLDLFLLEARPGLFDWQGKWCCSGFSGNPFPNFSCRKHLPGKKSVFPSLLLFLRRLLPWSVLF